MKIDNIKFDDLFYEKLIVEGDIPEMNINWAVPARATERPRDIFI